MKRTVIFLAAGAMLAGLAFAQPSAYYLWKNKTTGKTLCDPEPPGAAWEKTAGPFQDPTCKTPLPQ